MLTIDGYQVDDSRSRGRNQFKTKCPRCKEIGKKHLGDDLSIDLSEKRYHCFKCEWKGYFGEKTKFEKVEYKLPVVNNLTDLTDSHLKEFTDRLITQPTLIRNEVKTAKNNYYAFVYKEGEQIVNVKYRMCGEKKFMQAPEAKPTMYKYNDIVNSKTIIVCEGEFDALSWEEAGYLFATSVNAGAPNVNDENVEKKLSFTYNYRF